MCGGGGFIFSKEKICNISNFKCFVFGLSLFIHIFIYIEIYSLQCIHGGIQKKSQTTYTNLFPFKEEDAQLRVCPVKLRNTSYIQTN